MSNREDIIAKVKKLRALSPSLSSYDKGKKAMEAGVFLIPGYEF